MDFKFKSKNELGFTLTQKSERNEYDWQDPFREVQVSINQEIIKNNSVMERKIKKESRIPQKLNLVE